MKKIVLALVGVSLAVPAAYAASVVNRDEETHTLTVTEGGDQTRITVAKDETIQFCQSGCFVTMPNGDREVLTGSETIEIEQGRGRIR
ncbi:hypothetical protein [Nitratireductor sp. CH_MIT9313-5]|uniref:hypothetical protein n=1 Tax=Nitratireductor sp. CH_MIT9313-5 TaxID=3107764 RepID=UPI00300A84F0